MIRLPILAAGLRKPVKLIQSAYVFALVIIASMLIASFVLLNQMIETQQREERLISIAEVQRALSQRIVFLANAAQAASGERQAALVLALDQATDEFESGYALLLEQTGAELATPARDDATTVEHVLYAGPHHLDHFSTSLAANSRRLAAALETALGLRPSGRIYLADTGRAQLDERVATATMDGYSELRDRLMALSHVRLEGLMLTHRVLFGATLVTILLVAVFIFRPMATMIGRRTDQLVEARNAMAYNAVHDGLTGLYNRVFLNYRFGDVLAQAAAEDQRLAIIQFDLDRFKQINDGLGHAAGDLVLTTTARRMREAGRVGNLCIRLGGDEFVLVVTDPGDDDDVAAMTDRILRRINEPIVYEGQTIQPGSSAGIAMFPRDGAEASELLAHADVALYAAKKAGGSSYSFFTEALRRELAERKEIERDLIMAIARRDFTVSFQPQVSLMDGTVTGVEALIRWTPPGRDSIPPTRFLPIAESSGIMPAVGRIVFRRAIAVAAGWNRDGLQFGRLALNASGSELAQPDFAAFLFDILQEEGLPPQKLSLEIVESVILDDEKNGIAATLRTVRDAGIHLELDDFGTGYASLTHVDPRQIDRIKIDRRFVQQIHENDQNAHIVRAVTDLADRLGIGVVAEGAETESELSLLRTLGCDEVQGYGIAFPMPEDAMRTWLEAARTGYVRAVAAADRDAA